MSKPFDATTKELLETDPRGWAESLQYREALGVPGRRDPGRGPGNSSAGPAGEGRQGGIAGGDPGDPQPVRSGGEPEPGRHPLDGDLPAHGPEIRDAAHRPTGSGSPAHERVRNLPEDPPRRTRRGAHRRAHRGGEADPEAAGEQAVRASPIRASRPPSMPSPTWRGSST